jgi:transcription antitermination factor NusB
MAMQALYEDDLTDHDLDDILQHMGEHLRRELVQAYAEVRGSGATVIETIEFLVRHADLDQPDTALAHFRDAAGKALSGLSRAPDAAEPDHADESFPQVRAQVEQVARPVLERFRNAAEAELRRELEEDGSGVADAGSAAHELAADLARLRGEATPDVDDEERPGADRLAKLQREAVATLTETLADHERNARAHLMDMLQRTAHLARGVTANLATIDPVIEQAAPAFPVPQLASIDRSVLRVAIYELVHEPEVPFRVAINEAVEIAKQYGGPNSGRFVNGVLRTIAERLPPERTTGAGTGG